MKYLNIENVERGAVFDLLCRSFAPILNHQLQVKLKRYDDEVFDNPKTAGACVFLTQFDDQLIGMAGWDPRSFPKAIVGYNCIIPEYQVRGFGKQQLRELLKRLKNKEFTEVIVKTGGYPFYVPSQKMYESCGFKEIQRNATSSDARYGSIDYHLVL